ncbi:uncharacterized protein LOC117639399 isoform X2 [Thrips palmi]|uniref:Uncharacterized protein LOC117639399 isoform X2 n=1 Tax=Thrips palmi TaxID=161013 RepID=A0A6P8ZGY2_THRPL|nr:uncharacterized protein LOC117639399 isoform X2 [Thrips palmi]
MAGTLFVVCVPTREHEAAVLELGGAGDLLKQPGSGQGSGPNTGRSNDLLGVRLLGTRSKSEDSLFARDAQDDANSRREMFIGPWRVDATDLPRTPRSPRSPRTPRSPLLGLAGVSQSDPEGLSARPPTTTATTPGGSARKRRHRYLETELENVLKQLKINNAVWCMGKNNRYYQVLFSVESGNPCEEALDKLHKAGIGVLLDSVVSVLPCVLYYQGSEQSGNGSMDDLHADESAKKDEKCPGGAGSTGGKGRGEQGTWESFVQSVRANATFTFDFLLLLIVAALVAALGLFEDSTVILVASMLISPLMGPVMAATFGTMIHDWRLQRMGLVNECVGLLLCLLIGFVTGVVVSLIDRPWPTEEMMDRGLLRSLWVNVLIAVLSGMGIAIALLRDNTGSLVGVAISASLLPPAVNAGLLWGMSLAYYMLGADDALLDGVAAGAGYSANYSDKPEMEMAIMGGVSLCITFINIVFIYMTGILMLKVKEVAPSNQERFWQHDVKIARDYNTTLYGASAADILRSVVAQEQCGAGLADCADREGPGQSPIPSRLACLLQLPSGFPHHFGGDPSYLDVCQQHQLTWSPSTLGGTLGTLDTVRELEGLYRTIQQQQQNQQLHMHGTGMSRRASFGSCGAQASYPTWRLGCSDGYRCKPRKRRAAGSPRSPGVRPGVHRAPSAAAVHTPPFNNMPCKSLAVDTLATPAAFKTPLGPSFGSVPPTPSLFLTPVDHSELTPLAARDSAREVPTLSVNDETASAWLGDAAHRPAKKRRFIVTKAEDKEMLLPRD